jgi:hypothetical protein
MHLESDELIIEKNLEFDILGKSSKVQVEVLKDSIIA